MKWPGSHRLPVVKMIRVQTENFDPGAELEQLRSRNNGQAGAGMTEKALEKIEQQANERWELTATLIIHRVGPLAPNDNIVFVAAASRHRKQAFQACEFMIDTLKTNAPFWKKERLPGGTRWVETETS